MKLLALIALTLIPTLSFAKPNAEIARKADVIGKLAFGAETHTVRGEDAEEMVLSLYMKRYGGTKKEAKENVTVDAKNKDAGFSESSGWGIFVNAGEAAKYFANLASDVDDSGQDKDNSKKIAVGQQIIKELGKMGAKLGFTDSTSGYCGVSFGGLLIIDEESDTIYEISMTSSGSC